MNMCRGDNGRSEEVPLNHYGGKLAENFSSTKG